VGSGRKRVSELLAIPAGMKRRALRAATTAWPARQGVPQQGEPKQNLRRHRPTATALRTQTAAATAAEGNALDGPNGCREHRVTAMVWSLVATAAWKAFTSKARHIGRRPTLLTQGTDDRGRRRGTSNKVLLMVGI
jgi:hypothetical protein